jgi:SAM-dependent methyltransferase
MNCNHTCEIPLLRGPVALSHMILRQYVREDDHVVDATCGNGNDTLLLAELVGAGGKVWAFDIQQRAIEVTTARLTGEGHFDHVELVLSGHETMAAHCTRPVKAVVFNLGYLPGGDHGVVTRPASTLAGLEQALEILEPGGIAAITLYPGHDSGKAEQSALESRVTELQPGSFHVWRMGQMNVPDTAPYFMLIQKVP